ncbi:excisionase family protein [Bifidobacterium ramosum]|uniref:Excisionase family protein n=1 Tax=Bifidobacterium ramosum TaxID=1798158 RepID=A0A6L4WXK3_9BIFI|nr:helix-turn-helix domain-containing protein [Bifidobacterium ramosum]KAB8286758.1 excisionase family protein [Bifidobacterium ramosum]NEG72756.1 helix-turn-helix domain-containing protein [Bifidobacterium ramosum]
MNIATTATTTKGVAQLSDGKGNVLELTPEEYERAREAVLNVAGQAAEHITTGDAAKILGVSRRTVMRILDGGLIPYTRLGSKTYRYMKLDDVLEYKKRSEHERKAAMDEIHEIMDSADVSDKAIAEYLARFK